MSAQTIPHTDRLGAKPATSPVRGLPGWTMAIPLAILAVAAFLPVLDNGFVNLDDDANFLYNPHYRGLGRAQLAWAWTTEWLGVYQPLAWTLFSAQYAAFGLDPRGYHLTSLLLHVLTALALFSMTRALVARARPDLVARNPTGVVLGSALAVAIFAVHPLRVEAVAWASCQPYLPCAALAVLSARVYLGAADAPPLRRAAGLAVAWVLFAAALLFKAAAVALPAALLVIDVYPLRRLGGGPGRWFGAPARRVWLEKLPYLALSLVFAAMAVWAKGSNHSLVAMDRRGPLARIEQASYGACTYVGETAWPAGLCAYYPAPDLFDWRSMTYLACLTSVAAVSMALLVFRRRYPALLATWLAYLVILAPTSGLVTIGRQIAADRYSYLSTLAGVPLLTAAIVRLTGPGRGRLPFSLMVAATGLGLVAALAASSSALSRTWRDTVSLASHALNQGNHDPQIYLGLGWGLENRGDLAGAEASFREALRRDPYHAPAMVMLGMIRLRQGRAANAAALLAEAVRLQPEVPETHNALGNALLAQGRTADAIARFTEALRLRPGFAEARANLARARTIARRRGP
jgi:protein O-mannosyl-transferase